MLVSSCLKTSNAPTYFVVALTRAMAASSWDRSSADWDVSSDEGEEGMGWNDEQDVNPQDAPPEAAGDMLATKLLRLLNTGGLSAKSVCALSFFAAKAGAVGFVKQLAYNPNAQSGALPKTPRQGPVVQGRTTATLRVAMPWARQIRHGEGHSHHARFALPRATRGGSG